MAEIQSRFAENDQQILCALADMVFSNIPKTESYESILLQYQLDQQCLKNDKVVFENYKKQSASESHGNNAAMLVQKMFQEGLHQVLPFLYEATSLLATIPATSCSAERSFSGLQRLKTYLRSAMGQERLCSLPLLSIERNFQTKF